MSTFTNLIIVHRTYAQMVATKENNMDLPKGVKKQPRFCTFHLLHEINQIRRWVGNLKEH
jgi:hypothetical protein